MQLHAGTMVPAIVLGLLLLCGSSSAWHSEELEIFDLIEEVNKNFYEFMGINQTATNNEIKRAFRTLSIVLHPDKNAAEDANIQFRNLATTAWMWFWCFCLLVCLVWSGLVGSGLA